MKRYFLIIAVILFTSCNTDNEMTNDEPLIFSFHKCGGWTGLNEKLEINSTNTNYSISYREFGTWEDKSYETTVKTSIKKWDDLKKKFDLMTFTKIQDGTCRACLDGIDVSFSVTRNGNTYSIYNVEEGDVHYKQMQDFFDTILELADNFSTKKYGN